MLKWLMGVRSLLTRFARTGFKLEVELRVLDVPGYDLILGVDWLSQHEPTLTYWSKGIMHLQYKGREIRLQAQLEDSEDILGNSLNITASSLNP